MDKNKKSRSNSSRRKSRESRESEQEQSEGFSSDNDLDVDLSTSRAHKAMEKFGYKPPPRPRSRRSSKIGTDQEESLSQSRINSGMKKFFPVDNKLSASKVSDSNEDLDSSSSENVMSQSMFERGMEKNFPFQPPVEVERSEIESSGSLRNASLSQSRAERGMKMLPPAKFPTDDTNFLVSPKKSTSRHTTEIHEISKIKNSQRLAEDDSDAELLTTDYSLSVEKQPNTQESQPSDENSTIIGEGSQSLLKTPRNISLVKSGLEKTPTRSSPRILTASKIRTPIRKSPFKPRNSPKISLAKSPQPVRSSQSIHKSSSLEVNSPKGSKASILRVETKRKKSPDPFSDDSYDKVVSKKQTKKATSTPVSKRFIPANSPSLTPIKKIKSTSGQIIETVKKPSAATTKATQKQYDDIRPSRGDLNKSGAGITSTPVPIKQANQHFGRMTMTSGIAYNETESNELSENTPNWKRKDPTPGLQNTSRTTSTRSHKITESSINKDVDKELEKNDSIKVAKKDLSKKSNSKANSSASDEDDLFSDERYVSKEKEVSKKTPNPQFRNLANNKRRELSAIAALMGETNVSSPDSPVPRATRSRLISPVKPSRTRTGLSLASNSKFFSISTVSSLKSVNSSGEKRIKNPSEIYKNIIRSSQSSQDSEAESHGLEVILEVQSNSTIGLESKSQKDKSQIISTNIDSMSDDEIPLAILHSSKMSKSTNNKSKLNTSEPGTSKRDISRTSPSKVETSKPWTSKRDISRTSPSKVETSKPGTSKRDISRTSPSKVETSKPWTSKRDISRTSPSKVETSKPGTSKSDISRTSPSKVETSKPWTSKRDISRTSHSKVETSEPWTSKRDISRTSHSKVETSEPWTSKRDISRASHSKVETSKPGTSKSDISRVEASQRDISRISNSRVETSQRDDSRTSNSSVESSKINISMTKKSRIETSKIDISKTANSRGANPIVKVKSKSKIFDDDEDDNAMEVDKENINRSSMRLSLSQQKKPNAFDVLMEKSKKMNLPHASKKIKPSPGKRSAGAPKSRHTAHAAPRNVRRKKQKPTLEEQTTNRNLVNRFQLTNLVEIMWGVKLDKTQMNALFVTVNLYIEKLFDKAASISNKRSGVFRYSDLKKVLEEETIIREDTLDLFCLFQFFLTQNEKDDAVGILFPAPGKTDT